MKKDILNTLVNMEIDHELNKAIVKAGYKPGHDVTPILEEVMRSFSGVSSVNELWGPDWILFLSIVVTRARSITLYGTGQEAITHVTRPMVGHSSITSRGSVGRVVGEPVSYINMVSGGDVDQLNNHMAVTVLACKDLDIPSPLETEFLRVTLGENACPSDMEVLWKTNPEKYKLGHHPKPVSVSGN